MPWNLLILPLVAGYYLLTHFNRFKFKQQRLDRQRLIFDSVLIAIGLLVIAFFLRWLIEISFPDLVPAVYKFIPIKTPFIGTTFSALILSLLITVIGNKLTRASREIERSITSVGNELELLLLSSFKNSKLLEITLSTDKSYIGWAKELPIPSVTKYIRIIPAFSGVRDDQKRLLFTTEYLSIYAEYIQEGKIMDIKDLDVDLVISLDNVVNISFFDIEMYDKFNNPKGNKSKYT